MNRNQFAGNPDHSLDPLPQGITNRVQTLSRRDFLRATLGLGALSLLGAVACSPTAGAPSAAGTPAAASQSVATTQSAVAPKPTSAAVSTPKVVEIKVGAVGAQGMSPVEAGISMGLFERDGFKVEVLEHRGGAEAAQALVGGGIQIFQGDFTHAIRLNQQGQQIRVIAGVTNRHAYTLVGAPGAKPGIQNLRGQKLGISSPGSQTDNGLRWLLKGNGIDPDKDVELLAVGSGAPMVAALQNKQVYAGMVAEPFTSQLRAQDYPIVFDFWEETAPFQGLVFMVKGDWLKAQGDVVGRFLKSYLGVVRRLNEDETARTDLIKKAFPQLDPKVAAAAGARLSKAYTLDGKVDEAGVKKVFEFDKVAQGGDRRVPPLSEFADFSYLPQ